LHRFKATVSDKVGASSTLYQAIESKSNVSIMSAQGTTTGRKSGAVGDLQSSAVGDLLLRVPQPFDNVEFLLSVLAESQDCTIKDFREHKPIESSLDLNDRTAAFRTHAYVRSAGKELEIPTSVLKVLEPDMSDKKVIINWDTETTVLDLTFVRSTDQIGALILFLRHENDSGHTGE